MQLPTIKTYNPKVQKTDNQFYVLNKGYNSGRPSYTPNRNSFAVTCESSKHRDQCYCICFVLWKGRKFHPILCGSVIQFIRVREFKRILLGAMDQVEKRQEIFIKIVAALNRIETTERMIAQKLIVLKQMKLQLIQSLFK